MERFDGVRVDYNSVLGIISRLSLYIENEEKVIFDMKMALGNLDSFYDGSNASAISSKKTNLASNLDTLLEHKKKYIIYIRDMLESYMALDESTYLSYQEKDIN